jgi:hypothetical protein
VRPGSPSPDEALLDFVGRLPAAMRDLVLARCCMAFDRLHLTPKQDLLATFRAILMTPDGDARAYMCAKMSAVVELALREDGEAVQAAIARASFETAGPDRCDGISLQAPLTQKDWDTARDEFLALRAHALSIKSLHHMLTQASRPPRQPPHHPDAQQL